MRKPYTMPEVRYVSEHMHLTDREIGAALGRDAKSIRNLRIRQGWKKESNPGQFKPGGTPWNAGKPHPAAKKAAATQFQKGMLPHNTKHDGAISIRRGYQFIRLESRVWVPLHRYTWEQANGPVPKGHIVVFRDGDKMNCAIENLECIDRGQHACRNLAKTKDRRAATMRKLWDTERVRAKYGLDPKTKLGTRISRDSFAR